MGRKKLYAGVLIALCAAVFAGCNTSKEDGKSSALVSDGSIRTYEMTQVQRGDIQKTKVIAADYQQVMSENLSFSVDRRSLAGVYVSKGDTVTKGELLAELQCDDEKDRLAELEYNIKNLTMQIGHLQEQLELELTQLDRKKGSMSDAAYEEKVLELENEYRRQTEDMEDSIYIQQLQYDELAAWLAGTRIYAGMDGTVTFMGELGSDFMSWPGNKVFTVSAEGVCAFLCNEPDYISYFTEGETYVLATNTGIEYETVLTEIDEDGMMYFEPKVQQYDMPMGQRVLYSLVLEERENILYIPRKAVHFIGDEAYVYLYDSEGNREAKKIEVGLLADSKAEIISGLAEGDEVILR